MVEVEVEEGVGWGGRRIRSTNTHALPPLACRDEARGTYSSPCGLGLGWGEWCSSLKLSLRTEPSGVLS